MPRKRRPAAAAAPADPRAAIVEAALTLAARQGWRGTTLADIAAEARLSLADVHAQVRSRAGIVAAFVHRIDSEVLAGTSADLAKEPARDRLFDVLMRRFEALRPYRDGVRSILRAEREDPCAIACSGLRLLRSMTWMMEAAGLDATGLAGRLRAKVLLVVYAAALRVFLEDDSADLAKTMAALDRGLRRAETLQNLFCRGARPRGGPAAAAAAP
jgi:AcrR family transcriptional regulator